MNPYTVIARKFRPQTFSEVLGQRVAVTIIKNAIKKQRIGQAYLFCGVRGTGKTTLARLFAKALNCANLSSDGEPCNECLSCREITSGASLDVIEIDGASHRGIDDIRQINETVGYAPSSGKYKIYIIDEVHMLTKEAFNALLKTLEEPPVGVKFFFATTESHKIPSTIVSRCQRFNLNRISPSIIVEKLKTICQKLGKTVSDEALQIIASRSEGALRDAESLLDQILTFFDGDISAKDVADACGIVTKEVFFALDVAGKENNCAKAFEIAHQIFSQGKDINYFIDNLIGHYRTITLIKIVGKDFVGLEISNEEMEFYLKAASLYTKEQSLHILDFLLEAQAAQRFNFCPQIALEALLLRIIRSFQRLSIDQLVLSLAKIEGSLPPLSTAHDELKLQKVAPDTSVAAKQEPKEREALEKKAQEPLADSLLAIAEKAPIKKEVTPSVQLKPRYETLLQFAAIELEGRIERNRVTS